MASTVMSKVSTTTTLKIACLNQFPPSKAHFNQSGLFYSQHLSLVESEYWAIFSLIQVDYFLAYYA